MVDDWPVNIASLRIADILRTRIRQKSTASESLERQVLQRLFVAIRQPHARRALDSWLDFRRRAKSSRAGDLDRVSELLRSLSASGANDQTVADDLGTGVFANEQLEDLLTLFELLLGTTILRPLRSVEAGRYSSMYYASIYHPLLDDTTVKSIMESVVIPPGSGSAGDAIRNGQKGVVSPESFGERRGVVEWQDLVLGQVSMLVSSFHNGADARPGHGECSLFVASAFLPVPGVFDVLETQGTGSLVDLLVDSVESFRADLVCALCDAQADARDKRLSRLVLGHTHEVATRHGSVLDELVGKVAQRLVPRSFLERPSPLQAVAVALPRSEASKGFRLAYVCFEDTLVRNALRLSLPFQAAEFIHDKAVIVADTPTGPMALRDMLVHGDHGWSPRFPPRLANLFPDEGNGHIGKAQVLSFSTAAGYSRIDNRLGALWIIHTKRDRGWPPLGESHLNTIRRAFNRLEHLVERLSPFFSKYSETERLLDQMGVPAEWRRRNAVYKLRQNVLASFFDLLSRVLVAPTEDHDVAEQLQYILEVVLHPPWSATANDDVSPATLARDTGNAILAMRGEVLKQLGDDFLGTSSCVVIGGQIHLPKPEQLSISDLVSRSTVCDLIHTALLGGYRIEPLNSTSSSSEHETELRSCLDDGDARLFAEKGWLRIVLHDAASGHSAAPTHRATLVCRSDDGREQERPFEYTVVDKLFCGTTLSARPTPGEGLVAAWQNSIVRHTSGVVALQQIANELALRTGVEFHFEPPTHERTPTLLYALRTGEARTDDLYHNDLLPTASLLQDSIRASQLSASRTLESYARGAAHALKNALNAVEFLLGNAPEAFQQQIAEYVFPAEISSTVTRFASRMVAARRLIDHVRKQAKLFYWMMDPELATAELRSEAENTTELGAIVSRTLVEAAYHAILRVDRKQWVRQKWLLASTGPLVQDMEFALMRVVGQTDTRSGLERMQRVLRRYRVQYSFPVTTAHVKMSSDAASILVSILAELLQNAFKAVLRAALSPGYPNPLIKVEMRLVCSHCVAFEIVNSATQRDLDALQDAISTSAYERGVADRMSGAWQIELLRSRLGSAVEFEREVMTAKREARHSFKFRYVEANPCTSCG
jgi:hypothetical protein